MKDIIDKNVQIALDYAKQTHQYEILDRRQSHQQKFQDNLFEEDNSDNSKDKK